MTNADAPRRPAAASSEIRIFVGLSRDVIQFLSVLLRNAAIHNLSNEVFNEPFRDLSTTLEVIFRSDRTFKLEVSGEEFFANRTRIRMEIRSLHSYKYVLGALRDRALGGVLFRTGVSTQDLRRLLAVLIKSSKGPGQDEDAAAELNRSLADEGTTAISLLPPLEDAAAGLTQDEALDRRRRAIHAYQQALDFIRESLLDLDSPAEMNLRRAKRVAQRLVDLSYEEGDGFSLAGLASLKGHDDYTFNHIVNVCVLSIAFGQRLGLARSELAELGICALYHDLGKLQVPVEVLRKHGPLSEQEWALMGNHTVFAARSLFPALATNRNALPRILVALQHHLGYDGRGYPKLKVLRRQRLYSRIVAICDTFDAMTTQRVYQKRYLPDEAIGILYRGCGTRYDPSLVKAFVNCMGIHPPGSAVILSTGELAVVVESNRDPSAVSRPTVRLVRDPRGGPRDGELLDLSHSSQEHRRVIRCIDPGDHGINTPHFVV